MRGGAIFSAGVIGSVVVVLFCKAGVAFCTSCRGVIVMVVQLTWSCLCLKSGGANYLDVLVKGWWCNLQIGGALSGDVLRVKLYDPARIGRRTRASSCLVTELKGRERVMSSVWSILAIRRVLSQLQPMRDGRIMSEDVLESCILTLYV